MYYAQLFPTSIYFRDRQEAGQRLGAALKARGTTCDAVIGLPRGGVPVAHEVAEALGVPMDLIVVHKVGAPIQSELAIGAVCSDGSQVLHQDTIQDLGIPEEEVRRAVEARLGEERAAESRYRGGVAPLDLAGLAVTLVDDGIATGATMEAAVISARQRGARSVLVATPVGSRHACEALKKQADDAFCLSAPVEFWAVGQFYGNFRPVEDAEVRRLLRESRARHPARRTEPV